MKFSLRTIAVLITLVMLGVFLYQLYWLNGLYKTTSKQFDKDVYNAMDIADQYELTIRSELLEQDTAINRSLAMNVGMRADSTGRDVYYSYDKNGQDTINESETQEAGFNDYGEKVQTTENLAAYIKKTIHYGDDQYIPININVFDSILNIQLEEANINQAYQVFVVQTSTDSICFSANNNQSFLIKNARQFDYYYDFNGSHSYRLYIKNPTGFLLKQMVGLFLTSVIIFIFLVVTFFYLIRTIRKLQTEEELKTNFTNNMTHELKTPIAVSYAAIDALLVADQPTSKERRNKYLNIAKEQMEQLTSLVEQILSMSRKSNNNVELKIEKIDLAQLVSGLTEKLILVADKKVDIETHFEVETIKADKLHLSNMLNNLIENGIKYSKNEVQIKVSSYSKSNNVFLLVEDNGIGIDSKYQDRLFNKFYRVPTGNRHNVKGFGLGLFYVKEMIEKHGGNVTVESRPEKGSVFSLKIPQ